MLLPSPLLSTITKEKQEGGNNVVAGAFFGVLQPEHKKRRRRQLPLPSLVRYNQNTKNEGDGNCRCLLWCVAIIFFWRRRWQQCCHRVFWFIGAKKKTRSRWQQLPLPSLVCYNPKKNKKAMVAIVVAFFGALQPEKIEEGNDTLLPLLSLVRCSQKKRRRWRQ